MAKMRLYHEDYPHGKIVEEEEENALLETGWVDAEWKVCPQLKPWQKAQAARKAKRQESMAQEDIINE